MKSEIYPLTMPADLMGEVRQAAKRTGLSMAETMRQSVRLGLPELVGLLSRDELKNLKPLTKEESRLAWQVPDPEFDALAAHCAALPKPPAEEEE